MKSLSRKKSKKYPPERVRGPFVGWRWWKTNADGEPMLFSVSAGAPWHGPLLVAQDLTRTLLHLDRRAPRRVLGMGPGIYAFKRHAAMEAAAIAPRLARTDAAHRDTVYVYGSVEMFGHVVEHKHGYRAEKAIIRQLVIPIDQQPSRAWWNDDTRLRWLAEALEGRYAVDVDVTPQLENWRAA